VSPAAAQEGLPLPPHLAMMPSNPHPLPKPHPPQALHPLDGVAQQCSLPTPPGNALQSLQLRAAMKWGAHCHPLPHTHLAMSPMAIAATSGNATQGDHPPSPPLTWRCGPARAAAPLRCTPPSGRPHPSPRHPSTPAWGACAGAGARTGRLLGSCLIYAVHTRTLGGPLPISGMCVRQPWLLKRPRPSWGTVRCMPSAAGGRLLPGCKRGP